MSAVFGSSPPAAVGGASVVFVSTSDPESRRSSLLRVVESPTQLMAPIDPAVRFTMRVEGLARRSGLMPSFLSRSQQDGMVRVDFVHGVFSFERPFSFDDYSYSPSVFGAVDLHRAAFIA